MGTSSNPASPNTPSWDLAKALLGRDGVDPKRQSTELWRAASGERGDQLLEELSSPLVAEACQIAGTTKSVPEAINSFENRILERHENTLTLDLCKRALARTVAMGSGEQGFGAEFFGEITTYYASRDLPSFTAANGRIQTTSEAIQLKQELRSIAAETARSAGKVASDQRGWRSYVHDALEALQGRQ